MVNLKNYKGQIIEMAEFYIQLPDNVDSPSDKDYAELGKKSSLKIIKLLNKYGSTLKKAQFNLLKGFFMTLTRGVEQFESHEAQTKHLFFGELRYQVNQLEGEKNKES